MNLRQCVMCRLPIWDDQLNTTNAQFGSQYCQCPTLTIRLSDYTVEVLKSLSRQLAPSQEEVPQAFYEALSDEEVQL